MSGISTASERHSQLQSRRQQISVLGATGSIGDSTLDLLARHTDKFAVFAVSAHRQWQKLFQICQQFQPRYAVMVDAAAAEQLTQAIHSSDCSTEVLVGPDAMVEIAGHAEVDIVMAAVVGAAGLPSSLAAAKAGKQILLANKESLVVAGDLFMQTVQDSNATLLPVDSEHNALFQAMPAGYQCGVRAQGIEQLVLTASGGPFRETVLHALQAVTPDQACAHPNWDMGRKISVDSATMMNKGLELIEAHYLFQMEPDDIDVVIHPQSVVHSAVTYNDGSWLAQMGSPDMRIPIAHSLGLTVGERLMSGAKPLDLRAIARLDFAEPDLQRFPCLHLARQACEQGGAMPAVLNAVNEIAVAAFLNNQLGFMAIAECVESVLSEYQPASADSLEALLAIDHEARRRALAII